MDLTTFTTPQKHFTIINDSLSTTLTFQIHDDVITVYPYEQFYDYFPLFTEVIITASDSWRAISKTNIIYGTISDNSLITAIRYDLSDKYKKKFSDYDILATINSVLRYTNISLATIRSDVILEYQYTIPLVNNIGALPEDLYSVSRILNDDGEEIPNRDFKITKTSFIYTGEDIIDSIEMDYFRRIELMDTGLEELDLPDIFFEIIKKYSVMLLSKQITQFDQAFTQGLTRDITAISLTRNISNIDIEIPFIV
jgi:hypothetical protein